MATVVFPDERTKQAFLETQKKISTLNRKLGKVTAQQSSCERDAKHCEITLKELSQFPDSTITYKSVGKMFMKQDLEGLKNQVNLKREGYVKESGNFSRASEKIKGELGDATELVKDIMKTAKSD